MGFLDKLAAKAQSVGGAGGRPGQQQGYGGQQGYPQHGYGQQQQGYGHNPYAGGAPGGGYPASPQPASASAAPTGEKGEKGAEGDDRPLPDGWVKQWDSK
jgi:hypothetical protein